MEKKKEEKEEGELWNFNINISSRFCKSNVN